jgi:hypothetical protein
MHGPNRWLGGTDRTNATRRWRDARRRLCDGTGALLVPARIPRMITPLRCSSSPSGIGTGEQPRPSRSAAMKPARARRPRGSDRQSRCRASSCSNLLIKRAGRGQIRVARKTCIGVAAQLWAARPETRFARRIVRTCQSVVLSRATSANAKRASSPPSRSSSRAGPLRKPEFARALCLPSWPSGSAGVSGPTRQPLARRQPSMCRAGFVSRANSFHDGGWRSGRS